MGQRIGFVAKLVHKERVGCLAGQAFGDVAVVFRVALADIGAGELHFGTHRFQVEDFLLAHLVRNDEQQPIAFLRRHQRKPQAGVARRCFNEGSTGFELAVTLGRLNQVQANAVLDGATGVLILQLEKQLARPGIDVMHGHERRAADHLQCSVVNRRRTFRTLPLIPSATPHPRAGRFDPPPQKSGRVLRSLALIEMFAQQDTKLTERVTRPGRGHGYGPLHRPGVGNKSATLAARSDSARGPRPGRVDRTPP